MEIINGFQSIVTSVLLYGGASGPYCKSILLCLRRLGLRYILGIFLRDLVC